MNDIVEKEARQEKEHQEKAKDGVDLTPQGYRRALIGACKSFLVHGLSKVEIDGYVDRAYQSVN